MYLRDFGASLARRWIVVVLCLLATFGLAQAAWHTVPPKYETTADVVLIPPKSTEDPTANRYLGLGGLREAVDVLTRSLGSDSTRAAVRAIAPEGKFEAASDDTTNAPIFILTVTAKSPAASQKLLETALAQVPVNLLELQQSLKIDSENQITTRTVAQDEKPKAVIKGQIRAVGAITAFLLLLSAMLVAVLDHLLLLRKDSKLRKSQVEEVEEIAEVRSATLAAEDQIEEVDELAEVSRTTLADEEPVEEIAEAGRAMLVKEKPAQETRSRDVVSAKTRR